jgi:hypothetical protein
LGKDMHEKQAKKIWKIRTVKNYPEAHNHLLIGEVLEIEKSYVCLNCKTYHFGRSINGTKDVVVGEVNIRFLPWNRIEIINELPVSFDYVNAVLDVEEKHKIILKDKQFKCAVASSYDSRY